MKHRFLSKRYWKSTATAMLEAADINKMDSSIIDLSIGDLDLITNEAIIEKAFSDAKAGHTKYTKPTGDPELINELANFYNKEYKVNIETDEVMITVGACHGMYLALQAILDEGDEVIVPEPFFTPYSDQISLAKGRMVLLETREDENFGININRLRKLINERTKAIVLNFPNNPTGACLDRNQLEEIASVIIENDLIAITDEVYDAFSYSKVFLPLMSIEGMKERTITLGSFSKGYAMTGWRIGYVLAPVFIISCIRDINEGVCFTAPSISQRAALHGLRMRKNVQKQIVEQYEKRMFYAFKRIKNISGLSAKEPEGSIYIFVNIKKTGLSSEQFSKLLREEAKVIVIPGNAFGKSGEGYVRIACTVGIEILGEAFDRINKLVEKLIEMKKEAVNLDTFNRGFLEI